MAFSSNLAEGVIAIDTISARPLSKKTAEITWTIKPTNDPLVNSRFHILRSESPEGPYVDVSGPIVNSFIFLDYVNLKQKYNKVSWRIRVDDLITGVSVTYPQGTPDEAFRFHPDLERATFPEDFGPDFVALEIVRRNNLLLRRFTGRIVGYFPVRNQGSRCLICYDNKKKRASRSQCQSCYSTTFEGGFYDPITVFADVNPSPDVVQVAPFGAMEENQTIIFLSNFPLAKPNDMLIENSDRRWRVIQVNTVTKNRYVVQQLLQVQEITRSDAEHLLSVENVDFSAPPEDFIGFFPKKHSPREVPVEGSGLL